MGKTGSGKTTLARHLMSQRPYSIVLDTKGDLSWSGFKQTESVAEAFGQTHCILRPKDRRSIYMFYEQAYEEGGWSVYTDEVYQIGHGTIYSFPAYFVRGLTAGRSRGETMVTSTQRPRFLPQFTITESTHIFVFELNSKEDRKAISRLVGNDKLDQTGELKRYEFLYLNTVENKVIKGKMKL